MGILQILLTIALIAVMVFLMSKRYNGSMVLLTLGLITLSIITIITGNSIMGENSIGNSFLDLFELVRTKFAANLTGSILQVMCVFGYIAFMKAIKASKMLSLVCTKPLSKIENQFVIMSGAIILCSLIKLVLASHSSTTAMLIAALYPIMRAAGVSKETAGAAIIIGGTIDIGPSELNNAIFLGNEFVGAGSSIPEFFLNYQLLSGIISTVVIIVLFIIVNRYFDKKEGVNTEAIGEYTEMLKGTPKFYAIFPLLPLALLLIFSFVDGVKLSVPVANILCFVVIFILHLALNAKSFKESFNLSSKFFEGMGNAMVTLGSLFIVALLAMFIAFACGTGTPAMTTVLAIMPNLVASTGLNALTIAAPVIMAAGNGRALCFVAPAALITSAFSGVNVPTLIKRNVIPALGGTIAAIVSSLIFCA